MADVTITIPDDFYISPSDAARLLDVRVPDLALLQASGELTDVLVTYKNWRKFNLTEVARLRQKRMNAVEDGNLETLGNTEVLHE
jgi:hypothetical protein